MDEDQIAEIREGFLDRSQMKKFRPMILKVGNQIVNIVRDGDYDVVNSFEDISEVDKKWLLGENPVCILTDPIFQIVENKYKKGDILISMKEIKSEFSYSYQIK